MDSKELCHWGVKGMKWGIRRYQNSDGTLTNAGKKRYARDLRDTPLTKEERNSGGREANPHKWVKEDIERSKRLTDASSNAVQQLKTANRIHSTTSKRMDLSEMSDKEMRDRINREILERQYNDMFSPKTVSKGKERISKTLEVTGAVLGVTSSALGIALAIKELTGK